MQSHAMGLSAVAGLVAVVVSTVMLLISLVATPTDAAPFNVTQMLSAYPDYTQMNSLLASTGVAGEINARSSLTLLVVSNPVLSSFVAANPNAGTAQIGDLLRYHVLLQYLDVPELNTITVGNPSTVTTLYQTTGRAAGNSGSVNIYNNGTSLLVGQADVNTAPTTMILTNVTQIPYNISFLQIDSVVAPTGFGAPTVGANLTAILESGNNFNTLLSLLQSTGADVVFAGRETGSGITIFAPMDSAFNGLSPGALAGLTPAQSKLTVEYHALTSYYTLGSLTTLNNPAAPTVATANTAPGQYTVSVASSANGVVINSGVSNTTIISTLYDTPPTCVYAVGTILLPPEIFATAPAPAPALVPAPAPAPINGSVPTPAPAPLTHTPVPAPSPLSPTPAPSPLSPTPTPAPAPSPLTPSPTPAYVPAPSPLSVVPAPVPAALSPGPPAPPSSPTGSIPGEVPAEAPGISSSPKADATLTTINVAVLAAMALISTVVML